MSKKLLVKGGTLLDPSQGLHGVVGDVLIKDGVFTGIGGRIDPEEDMQVVDAAGYFVSPGFIDIHAHVCPGTFQDYIPADMIGVTTGTTAIVDAGSAGPANIDKLVEGAKMSRTRVYSAMHYATTGLMAPPEADDPSKYDLQTGIDAYNKYKDYIVAIKARASASCVGQLGITSIAAGKALARAVGKPMLVHIGHMPPTIEEVLDLLDKGDIITHSFHGKDNNLLDNGQIKPQTQAARDRGVKFDIGHGKDSLNFHTAARAKELGFMADTISTDLHSRSICKPVYSLSETMDKFLALGYTLEECVEKVTSAPAELLSLEKLGRLRVGGLGDLTIFGLETGEFSFLDSNKNEMKGEQSIAVRYTVVNGQVEMDSQDLFHDIYRRAEADRRKVGHYEYVVRRAMARMRENGVVIQGDFLPPFLNHMVMMLMRLESGEHLPDMGAEALEGMSEKALAVTDQVLDIVESFYGRPDDAERVLIAIHIQTALDL